MHNGLAPPYTSFFLTHRQHNKTITDVPLFSFGFNAFVWILAVLHVPLERAPPRPLAAGEGEELCGSRLGCGLRLPGFGSREAASWRGGSAAPRGGAARRETEMVRSPRAEAEPEFMLDPALATIVSEPDMVGGTGREASGAGTTSWTMASDGEEGVEILTALPPAPPAEARLVE